MKLPLLVAMGNLGNIAEAQSAMLRITTVSVRLGLEWKNKDLPKSIV